MRLKLIDVFLQLNVRELTEDELAARICEHSRGI
jgi:hypothetical protein